MGLFGFITGSKKKTNLTPDVSYPRQENAFFTSNAFPESNLRLLTAKKLRGEGLGFGEDYLSKAANPSIAQLENSFQKQTVPFLSSQASARGMARSAGVGSALDTLGQAERQKNLDVNELISKFYNLNEMQKKTDYNQATGLAERLNAEDLSYRRGEAEASERQVGRNIEGDRYNTAYQDQAGKNILGMVASAIGAGAGMGMGGLPVNLGSVPGAGAISTYGANNIPQGFGGLSNPAGGVGGFNLGQSTLPFVGGALSQFGGQSGAKTNTLGSYSDSQIDQLIALLQGAR